MNKETQSTEELAIKILQIEKVLLEASQPLMIGKVPYVYVIHAGKYNSTAYKIAEVLAATKAQPLAQSVEATDEVAWITEMRDSAIRLLGGEGHSFFMGKVEAYNDVINLLEDKH